MQSSSNAKRYITQREFFDKPLRHVPGSVTGKVTAVKPMEVYHKMTPVRSIQQSINLIRALKTEQKEQVDKVRPKSVYGNAEIYSDSYGTIPNLRETSSSAVYLPIKERLMRRSPGIGSRKTSHTVQKDPGVNMMIQGMNSVQLQSEDGGTSPRLTGVRTAEPRRRKYKRRRKGGMRGMRHSLPDDPNVATHELLTD